jgi:hypothetical protein
MLALVSPVCQYCSVSRYRSSAEFHIFAGNCRNQAIITQNPLSRVNALRKNTPLQKIEAGYASLRYRVIERTASPKRQKNPFVMSKGRSNRFERLSAGVCDPQRTPGFDRQPLD